MERHGWPGPRWTSARMPRDAKPDFQPHAILGRCDRDDYLPGILCRGYGVPAAPGNQSASCMGTATVGQLSSSTLVHLQVLSELHRPYGHYNIS